MRDLRSIPPRSTRRSLILLVVCLVLGIGTFLAVVFGLAGSGGGQVSGEPSGVLVLTGSAGSSARAVNW